MEETHSTSTFARNTAFYISFYLSAHMRYVGKERVTRARPYKHTHSTKSGPSHMKRDEELLQQSLPRAQCQAKRGLYYDDGAAAIPEKREYCFFKADQFLLNT